MPRGGAVVSYGVLNWFDGGVELQGAVLNWWGVLLGLSWWGAQLGCTHTNSST